MADVLTYGMTLNAYVKLINIKYLTYLSFMMRHLTITHFEIYTIIDHTYIRPAVQQISTLTPSIYLKCCTFDQQLSIPSFPIILLYLCEIILFRFHI